MSVKRRRWRRTRKNAASRFHADVVCVIPAYNEADTVGTVVSAAKVHCDLVITVDDGSDDDTAINASSCGAVVVSHPFNLGAGAAVKTGVALALSAGATKIVTIDADGQHSAGEIPSILKPIVDGTADLVVGSRKRGGSEGMPFYKRLGNAILAFLASRKSGVQITDSESGFRAMTRNVAERVRYDGMRYSYASELIVRSKQQGYRVSEIPIRSIYPKGRSRGTSIVDGLRIALKTITIRSN